MVISDGLAILAGKLLGCQFTFVPFQGGAPAITAVMGGQAAELDLCAPEPAWPDAAGRVGRLNDEVLVESYVEGDEITVVFPKAFLERVTRDMADDEDGPILAPGAMASSRVNTGLSSSYSTLMARTASHAW